MHELRDVKISHHTCILQCTCTYVQPCCMLVLHVALVSISGGRFQTLVCVIMLYASFGLGQGLHIWHTMGQVLPAAICGAFH